MYGLYLIHFMLLNLACASPRYKQQRELISCRNGSCLQKSLFPLEILQLLAGLGAYDIPDSRFCDGNEIHRKLVITSGPICEDTGAQRQVRQYSVFIFLQDRRNSILFSFFRVTFCNYVSAELFSLFILKINCLVHYQGYLKFKNRTY